MFKAKQLYFLFFFLFISLFVTAQTCELGYKSISINSDLSSSNVNDIVIDRAGMVWIATDYGLNRFDAYEIKTYLNDENDNKSISHNFIFDLCVDELGIIWIATLKGVDKFNPLIKEFLHFKESRDHKNENSPIQKLISHNSEMYAVSSKNEIYKITESDKTLHQIKLDSLYPQDLSVIESVNSFLFFANKKGKLFRHDILQKETIVVGSLENEYITAIKGNGEGDVFIGTDIGNLYAIEKDTLSLLKTGITFNNSTKANRNDIYDIEILGDENLLISSRSAGITIFNYRKNSICNSELTKHFENKFANVVLTQNNGDCWIATKNEGVTFFSYSENYFTLSNDINKRFKLDLQTISALCVDSKGVLWLGVPGEGILRSNSDKLNEYSYLENHATINVNYITEIEGNLWFTAANSGLYCRNASTRNVTAYLPNTSIVYVYGNNEEAIIALSDTGEIFMLDNNSSDFRNINISSLYENDSIVCRYTSIIQDKDGYYWLGSISGLLRIDQDWEQAIKYVANSHDENGLSSNYINCLFLDKNANLWVGTQNGLNRYGKANDKFISYTTENGLPENYIQGITEDTLRNMWIATKSSIVKFHKETQLFEYISNEDDLPIAQFSRNCASTLKHGTKLIFGGRGGICLFDYKLSFEQQHNRDVIISDIKVFNTSVFEERDFPVVIRQDSALNYYVNLNHKSNVITFDFTDLNFLSSNHSSYEYLLEGFDKEWNKIHDRRSATYTKLHGGKYVLRYKLAGQAESNERKVFLEIEPPFWQTYWFWIIAAILFAVFIYFVYTARMSRMVRMKSFLKRQVTDRTKALEAKNEEIRAQKEMLLEQRDIANNQNAQIVVQKQELEAQRVQLEEQIKKRTEELKDARNRAEQIDSAYKRSENKYRLISNNSRDMIFRFKYPEEIFEFVSPGAVILTGYTVEEFYNDPTVFKKLFSNEYKATYVTIRKHLKDKDIKNEYEFKLERKNGELIWCTLKFVVVRNDAGDVIGLDGIIFDISDIKKKETSIKAAKQRAKERDRLKSSIDSELLQEKQSPLNTILNFTELLSDPDITFDEKEVFIQGSDQNTNSLLHFVDDVIDFSKIEAGKLEITYSQCYVNNILEELRDSFVKVKEYAGKEHIGLIVKTAVSEDNFSIYTDTFRFRQIMLNLIGNALRFTNGGEIEFGYKLDVDDVNEISEDDKITFYVKDTGTGFPSEQEDVLQTIEANLKEKEQGQKINSGLGLVISKSLIKLLGGEFVIESELGEGTSFIFTLPLKKQKGFKASEKKKTSAINLDWASKTILVAEDEENNFKFINAALKKTKANLIWAKDGEEAVAILKDNLKQIDIILMDIQMPKMNGYEATKASKKIDPNVPIIAQTAFAMSGSKIKCFDSGCDGYIAKPYKAKDLIEIISKHI